MSDNALRIGTRDSQLALWQANKVADLLEAEEELITSRPPEVIASPHAHSACSVLFRGDEVKHQPTRPLRSTNWRLGQRLGRCWTRRPVNCRLVHAPARHQS